MDKHENVSQSSSSSISATKKPIDSDPSAEVDEEQWMLPGLTKKRIDVDEESKAIPQSSKKKLVKYMDPLDNSKELEEKLPRLDPIKKASVLNL